MSATKERRPIIGTLRLPSLSPPPPPTPPPPTPSAKPEKRVAQRVATLAKLRATWPLIFDVDKPVPLAIGIREQVREALGLSSRDAHDAFQWWCSQPAYRAAVAAGGPRYGLDAEPAGTVTDQERAFSTEPRCDGRRRS